MQIFQNHEQKAHKKKKFLWRTGFSEYQTGRAATLTLTRAGFMLQIWDFHLWRLLTEHGSLWWVLLPRFCLSHKRGEMLRATRLALGRTGECTDQGDENKTKTKTEEQNVRGILCSHLCFRFIKSICQK